MRYIFSLTAALAIGLFTLIGCHSAAKSVAVEQANSNSKPTAANTNSEEAPRISLEDAKKDFDDGKALFIDTRSADQYKAEHVKGAINIPAGEFETRYKEVPKDKKIIAYCS